MTSSHPKTRRFQRASALLVLPAFLLAACASSPEAVSTEQSALQNWQGQWSSFDGYLDDPALQPVYEAVQQHAAGYSAKGVHGAFKKMYRTPFQGMQIDGNTVRFTDREGKLMDTVQYAVKGEYPSGHGDSRWTLLEATNVQKMSREERSKLSREERMRNVAQNCRYMMVTAVHGHGDDGLKHWHMRCSGKGFDALVTSKAKGVPTFVASDTTAEAVARNFSANPKNMAKFIGAPLQGWQGEWVSASALMADPAMKPALKKIAAEAKKLGKKYTAKSVQAHFAKRGKTAFDRVTINANGLVTYHKKDGSTLASCRYINDGLAGSWTAWVAEKGCRGMSRMIATGVHGKGSMTHWHFRYSDAADAFSTLPKRKDWTGTGFDPARLNAGLYAQRYLENAAKYAERLP